MMRGLASAALDGGLPPRLHSRSRLLFRRALFALPPLADSASPLGRSLLFTDAMYRSYAAAMTGPRFGAANILFHLVA